MRQPFLTSFKGYARAFFTWQCICLFPFLRVSIGHQVDFLILSYTRTVNCVGYAVNVFFLWRKEGREVGPAQRRVIGDSERCLAYDLVFYFWGDRTIGTLNWRLLCIAALSRLLCALRSIRRLVGVDLMGHQSCATRTGSYFQACQFAHSRTVLFDVWHRARAAPEGES